MDPTKQIKKLGCAKFSLRHSYDVTHNAFPFSKYNSVSN